MPAEYRRLVPGSAGNSNDSGSDSASSDNSNLRTSSLNLSIDDTDTAVQERDDIAVGVHIGGEVPTTLPWRQLSMVYLCISATGMSQNLVVPYIVEMCEKRFGVKRELVGMAAGFLVGGFTLASFTTSFYLGHLSDIHGRKPLIALGLSVVALSTLLFSISTTFWLALLARTAGGLLNGNAGILRASISDLVGQAEPQLRARAFGYMGAAFAASRALGSALAGMTAGPLLGFWPFVDNDYLLPGVVGAAFNLICLFLLAKYLPETRGIDMTLRSVPPTYSVPPDSVVGGQSSSSAVTEAGKKAKAKLEALSLRDGVSSIVKDKLLRLLVLTFATHTFLNAGLLFSMVLLYSLPVEDGGLGFTAQENGGMMFIFGTIAIAIQLFAFKHMAARMNLTALYQLGTGLLAVGSLLIPVPTLFVVNDSTSAGAAAWIAIAVIVGLVLATGFMTGLPVMNTLVSNSADRRRYGLVQGTATSLGNLTRALGPIFIGFLFSALVALKVPWAISIILGVGYAGCFAVGGRIKSNRAWAERAEGRAANVADELEVESQVELLSAGANAAASSSEDDETNP